MIDLLFPPVPADDEVERAARDRALVALREAARDARAGRRETRRGRWRRAGSERGDGALAGRGCGSPCPA